MSCPGVHCACCAGGIVVPVVPILEICGTVWVIEHIVEVAIVCGVSGALAVAASVLLMRWSTRRDDRRLAVWRARYIARNAPEAVQYVRAEVVEPAEIATASGDFTGRALQAPTMVINVFGTLDADQAQVIRRALGG
jgi:hypothetical protein